MHTCRTCHTVIEVQNHYSDMNYCSQQCFLNSKEFKKNTALLITFVDSLDEEQYNMFKYMFEYVDMNMTEYDHALTGIIRNKRPRKTQH